MISFILIAAALLAGAAAVIAVPLLRKDREGAQAPWTAVAVIAVLALGAVTLYAALSNWSWSQASAAADSPQGMVARLARNLRHNPDDLDGWLMLGRSYLVLQEAPLAARAFENANRLAHGRNPEALIGLAEALSVQDESELNGRAGRLIEQALALAPDSPRALFFGAASALHRGELPLARQRFATVLALDPPENVKSLIEQQIAAIDQQLAGGTGAAAPGAAAPGAAGAAGPSSDAAVRINVALSPKVRLDPASQAPLFVFVRDPQRPGPPLAVKRLPMRFPQTVELTAADSMIAGRSFVPGQQVEVIARIALRGTPIGRSGDPFGEASYKVGADGVVNVVIDRLTP